MATQATRGRNFQGPPAETYDGLVAALAPRPLRDLTDYENAVEMIGRLAGYELNTDQEDYLEALAMFVERYEMEHPRNPRGPRGRGRIQSRLKGIDMLRALLKEHGMSGADLSRLLNASRHLGPMILRGERNLTAAHARTLGEHFSLDPGVFIR